MTKARIYWGLKIGQSQQEETMATLRVCACITAVTSVLWAGEVCGDAAYSVWTAPQYGKAVLDFADARVEANHAAQKFIVEFPGVDTFEYSFQQVVNDLEDDPGQQQALLSELNQALSDPQAAWSYHSHLHDPDWGIRAGSSTPPHPVA